LARARRRAGKRSGQVIGVLSLAMALSLSLVTLSASTGAWGQPLEAPGVFLPQANIPRAKALALDAALIKGWRVAVSGQDHSVFETLIRESPEAAHGVGDEPEVPEVPEVPNVPEVPVLLRIRADFLPEAGGVRVVLTATEIRFPGTRAESSADVTHAYAANLGNALASLRAQWEDFALGGRRVEAASPAPRATLGAGMAAGRQAAPTAPKPMPEAVPIGQWAFAAEAFARQQGCQLGERGAALLGGRAQSRETGHEVHRVSCENRSALMVRCDTEGCRSGP
jgi:hypothetical protein